MSIKIPQNERVLYNDDGFPFLYFPAPVGWATFEYKRAYGELPDNPQQYAFVEEPEPIPGKFLAGLKAPKGWATDAYLNAFGETHQDYLTRTAKLEP